MSFSGRLPFNADSSAELPILTKQLAFFFPAIPLPGQSKAEPALFEVDSSDAETDSPERNHRIGDEPLAPAGQIGKIKANLQALSLLRALEDEKRLPTPEEKRALAQYTGWGHSPQVFDEIKAEYWQSHIEDRYSYGYNQDPEGLKNWANKFYEHYRALKDTLTPEEWSHAEASTLNAYYTSREIIEHGLWGIATHLGFAGGRVLENSAGIGHVIGLVPASIVDASRFTACELDSITGRMLKLLYPEATVHVMGFQDAAILPHSQDLIIGNFPFDQKGWSSEKYPFSLHNQFFARSLDLTAPGGVIVAITSDSTLDSPASAEFRRWMAQRADLIGAIRLPNDAFKKHAGTEVTTDILAFRKKDSQPFEHAETFVHTRPLQTGRVVEGEQETVEVNEYYHRHPEMVLGTMTRQGAMYDGDRPALIAHPDTPLLPQLQKAVSNLPKGIVRGRGFTVEQEEDASTQAEEHQKEGSYQLSNGQVRKVVGGRLSTPALKSEALQTQAKHWIALREGAKDLFAKELSPRATDSEIEEARTALRGLYDAYVKDYGRVNKSSRPFIDDPEWSIPAALENEVTEKYQARLTTGAHVDRLRQAYVPADILSKRVLYPACPPNRADSIADAATVSRSWRGALDLEYMAALLGKPQEHVKQELLSKGLGFEDPATGRIVPSDEYLSGNVREKLRLAQETANEYPKYRRNVDALTAVQPEPLRIHQIKFTLGATWMPTQVIEGWLASLFGRPSAASVTRVAETGKFVVEWDFWVKEDAKNTDTYAGGGVRATELIEDALNLKASIAYDEIYNSETGKTAHVKNPERTAAAQDAQQKLKDAYCQWVKRSEFVPQIEAVYNQIRNAYRQRQWEAAEFRHFPGASTAVDLRPHQKTSIARNMVESNLIAHPVGSGKTYVYASTAMEWRRLGLAKKPLIAVLKSTIGQVEDAFRRLYPQAKLLVPHEKDFSRENRQKLLARITTGDYDAIIITHDNLNGIPDDSLRERDFIQDRLSGLVAATMAAMEVNGYNSPTVKQLRQAKNRLEKRLLALQDRKTDSNLTFEQLGIDGLIVDEAHMYKKLEFETQMDNIKGLDKGASQRGSSLFMKARYVQEKTGGRNVLLGTGTPITNTVAEIWTMMRYVRPDLLADYRVSSFDEFATAFTEPITQLEQTDTGQYRHVTRLAKFTNLPELQTLFRSAADVVDPDSLHIPKPALEGGAPRTITLPQTPQVKDYMQYLIRRYEAWHRLTGREKRERSAEPLVINGLAKKAALDMRLIDPNLPDDRGSKLNRVVQETFDRWQAGMATKTTQVLFADSYQSPGYEAVTGRPIPDHERFNVFRDIKAKLIALGVPADEIADIHDHDSNHKKALLFERVNRGEVRVIMGGTEKLGTGTNIQAKLKAAHHIDAPWRPSDMEQREGRMIRQGNENPTAEVLRYGVDRSFDANAYQRLDTKARFIQSIMNGTNTDREVEDAGVEAITSFADAFAAISGNPLVRERFDLETRIRHLERLRAQFEADQCRAGGHLRQAKLDCEIATRYAAEIRKHIALISPGFADAQRVTASVAGKSIEGREQVIKALDAFVAKHLKEVSQALQAQLTLDRQARDIRDRRLSLVVPAAVTINGIVLRVQAHAQYRPADMLSSERMSDPELSYSYRVPNTDLWKTGTVTTGRGFLESVSRKIAELTKDATTRDGIADTKRRQLAELTALQDRSFTYTEELESQRRRLAAVIAEFEQFSNSADESYEPSEDDTLPAPEVPPGTLPATLAAESANA